MPTHTGCAPQALNEEMLKSRQEAGVQGAAEAVPSAAQEGGQAGAAEVAQVSKVVPGCLCIAHPIIVKHFELQAGQPEGIGAAPPAAAPKAKVRRIVLRALLVLSSLPHTFT
jgi:hypothetical protein